MKKRYAWIAVLLAAVTCLCAALTGCGGNKTPSEADAQKYVQAILDLMCTGDYDKSVRFADIEEGKELEMRDQLIDQVVASAGQEAGVDEETLSQFREILNRAFGKCKYTVGEAEKTDDGGEVGFDVHVSIEPFQLFAGASDALTDQITKLQEGGDILTLSQEELFAKVFDALFSILDKNLENPQYGEAQELVVHYGIQQSAEEDAPAYGIGEEDAQAMGGALFSLEGLE